MADSTKSSGLARSSQLIDSTAFCVGAMELLSTSNTPSNILFAFDKYGNQIPIETVTDKLSGIWKENDEEFADAWAKLARM